MDIQQAYKKCVSATKQFVLGTGLCDVVIGLSGGIDSSLVLAIAAEALGPSHVHGVLIPGPYSSKSSRVDATQLADNFGVETFSVSINSMVKECCDSLAKVGLDPTGVVLENIQARCRMVVLMAFSNKNNWLLLNTSNKSEIYMGYSTLYGDSAGAFAPIGGLYKTQVYEMCEFINRCSEKNNPLQVIPQNVLDKAPSAELSKDQTDEKSLGMSYKTIDAILKKYLDEKLDVSEIVALGFDLKDVQIVVDRVKSSEYKRMCTPVCP